MGAGKFESETNVSLVYYSHLQLALGSVNIGPKVFKQSQLHLGVLSAGQVILQVSFMPMPQSMIAQKLETCAQCRRPHVGRRLVSSGERGVASHSSAPIVARPMISTKEHRKYIDREPPS